VRKLGALFTLVAGTLLAGAVGFLPFAAGLERAAEVEVRTVPWRTQTGRLSDSARTGQGFRCRWNGLSRIEIAVAALGPAEGAQLDLELRADKRGGEVLRRSRVTPVGLAGGRGYVPFDFEPLSDSAGRDFWFELGVPGQARQSPYSAWIRYHGQPGIDAPWGNRILPGTVFEGRLVDNSVQPGERQTWAKVPHAQLAAVAFAVEALRPATGLARLELWDEGADPATDAPRVSTTLSSEEEVLGGYAFFAFEPLAHSRWKDMRYRLTVGAAARVVGFGAGPSFKTFHGGTPAEPSLLGMTRAERLHLDRSLVFRARSSPSRAEVFELIESRAGWKLWCGALCWVLGVVLALRLFLRR
jgi:hypothetical protein